MIATRFAHPMKHTGTYPQNWAGYYFKESLGYTTGLHTGCDYNFGIGAADKGLPIGAIANGTIRLTQDLTSIGFGNTVIIEHVLSDEIQKELGTTKLYSRYMHLENLNYAKVGQSVSLGQKIGTCGKSGTAAYHLHIDLWKANLGVHTRYDKNTQLASYLDPYLFIEAHKEEEVKTNREEAIWLWRTVKHKHSPTEAEKVAWTNKDLVPILTAAYGSAWFKKHTTAVRNYDAVKAENIKLKEQLAAAQAGTETVWAKVKAAFGR